MDIKGETASSKLGVRLGMKFRPIRAQKRVGAPRARQPTNKAT